MESLLLRTNGKHILEITQIPAISEYVPPIVKDVFIFEIQETNTEAKPHLNKLLSEVTVPELSGCKSTRSVLVAVCGYIELIVRSTANTIMAATFQCWFTVQPYKTVETTTERLDG